MIYSEEQINNLKAIIPNLETIQEGGYNYIYIEKLNLPEGCVPEVVDALLCPTKREGYESRLYFSSKISGCANRNWNGNIRAVGRNWFAISWKVKSNLTLVEMLSVHLNALRK